jgi:hypothetical protein
MATLARTYQFRSHWVQGNVPDLREFSSGLADLERVRGEIRERRVLLRATAIESTDSAESPTGQLLAAVPDDAGLYRAWLHPSTTQAANRIEEILFAQPGASTQQSKTAPMVAETGAAGSEIDLESRIDERPFTQGLDPLKTLRDKLAAFHIDAMLDVSSTKVDSDQVYVRPHSVIALLSSTAWDADAILAALGSAAEGMWSNSGAATWRTAAGGIRELEGLGEIAMAADGKLLVIGDSAAMVNAVFALRNRTPIAGAAYAAGWRHARELPNFERMTRLIDFPQLPPPGPDEQQDAGEPPYFSGNLASLGRTLKRIDAATIVVHDAGAMLRESVTYKLLP